MDNKKIQKINEISLDIGALAVQAILYEVACFPSPGLVSPVSNGAHKDMNFYTFIDSTSIIMKSLVLFAQKGLSEKSPKEIFYDIRNVGIQAEKDMFLKTLGVNTHKGMIFLMGICCAAVSKVIYENKEFNSVQAVIKEMCSDLTLNDFKGIENKSILSNGEKLYIKYNLRGVRGQAEDGIPLVFDYALDIYRNSSNLSKNDRLVNTLIGIMQFCEDTTIINRHSLEVLEWVKVKSKHIISLGGMKTDIGKDKIEELAKVFIEKNISPGGSADLLGITVFLSLVEEYIQKNYTHN
ncbi:triphosphoribosyl-dephospho-CoA synthase CitG [Clostridium tarantellae]|uniref:Probable 2-(5''-triphosphoribosyl)-3'-dephosphocoenzyme-A synthase n=1 Tax=Clostridium tarantellae TaxID=39493 RepID=A0A6I1MJW5_9CLOT|nr:triphosphoribosyl-dephospho-CoA synthase CitG [Clostridium tarantellae]MPQ43816.1 triphosphoribosyl-dephospho-CoA synthase CitG [Clostridium tarantellae]